MYGMWSVLGQHGSLPHSREGASASVIDNSFYVFGGFSRDLFGDLRCFDIHSGQWRIIPQQKLAPGARYTHTMLPYDKKIVVFGGAGSYMTAVKMRLCFNDIHIFDTTTE